jgi:hypothetical protein
MARQMCAEDSLVPLPSPLCATVSERGEQEELVFPRPTAGEAADSLPLRRPFWRREGGGIAVLVPGCVHSRDRSPGGGVSRALAAPFWENKWLQPRPPRRRSAGRRRRAVSLGPLGVSSVTAAVATLWVFVLRFLPRFGGARLRRHRGIWRVRAGVRGRRRPSSLLFAMASGGHHLWFRFRGRQGCSSGGSSWEGRGAGLGGVRDPSRPMRPNSIFVAGGGVLERSAKAACSAMELLQAFGWSSASSIGSVGVQRQARRHCSFLGSVCYSLFAGGCLCYLPGLGVLPDPSRECVCSYLYSLI